MPTIAKDLHGQSFSRLAVLESARTATGRAGWRCICQCGSIVVKMASDLTSGRVVSCGCLKAERIAAYRYVHGARSQGESPEYKAWVHAKARCVNPNDQNYQQYGGRGIVMSDSWVNNFPQFLTDMGVRPPGLTLERLDVNGPYCKSNCVWASRQEQSRNRRTTRLVTYRGQPSCFSEIGELENLDGSAISRLVKRKGLTVEQAVAKLKT